MSSFFSLLAEQFAHSFEFCLDGLVELARDGYCVLVRCTLLMVTLDIAMSMRRLLTAEAALSECPNVKERSLRALMRPRLPLCPVRPLCTVMPIGIVLAIVTRHVRTTLTFFKNRKTIGTQFH